MEKIAESLKIILDEGWIAAAVGAGGVLLCFAITLTLGLLTGDFIKNRRALLALMHGDIENGFKMLNDFAPVCNGNRRALPPKDAFEYGAIVGVPYSYSILKKLPSLTATGMAFFTVFSFAMTIIGQGESPVLTLIFVPLAWFLSYIAAIIVRNLMLKSAGRRYRAAVNLIGDINAAREIGLIPACVAELCGRVDGIAAKGGAGYKELNELYGEIAVAIKKYPADAVCERLAGALDVLGAIVDSALNEGQGKIWS